MAIFNKNKTSFIIKKGKALFVGYDKFPLSCNMLQTLRFTNRKWSWNVVMGVDMSLYDLLSFGTVWSR